MNTNKALIVFVVIYNIILIFFSTIDAYTCIVLAPVFLFISTLALCILFYHKVIRVHTIWDKVLLLFSTPIPLLTIAFSILV